MLLLLCCQRWLWLGLIRGLAPPPGLLPTQLTATKAGRQLVKEKGTYLVVRELHQWETEPDVLAACEKLIQVGAEAHRVHVAQHLEGRGLGQMGPT